jgi:hypothetical protein
MTGTHKRLKIETVKLQCASCMFRRNYPGTVQDAQILRNRAREHCRRMHHVCVLVDENAVIVYSPLRLEVLVEKIKTIES